MAYNTIIIQLLTKISFDNLVLDSRINVYTKVGFETLESVKGEIIEKYATWIWAKKIL